MKTAADHAPLPLQSGSAEFRTPREAMASPLAKRLFGIDGVSHLPRTCRPCRLPKVFSGAAFWHDEHIRRWPSISWQPWALSFARTDRS